MVALMDALGHKRFAVVIGGAGGGAGHWLAEQASEELVAALTEFLAPYREDGGGLR